MEMDVCHFDGVKWELFEKLLPKLLYTEDPKASEEFLCALAEDGRGLLYTLLCQMCEEDGKECRCGAEELAVTSFRRRSIAFLQMDLPPCNPKINDIVRAYILSSGDKDRRYFLIKRFLNGKSAALYVDPGLQVWKIDDLTGHESDRNYEYWRLAMRYLNILEDAHPGERTLPPGDWSRDWLRTDWPDIHKKLQRGSDDIGISEEEYMEFLRWFSLYDKEAYHQMLLYLVLKELRVSKEEAVSFAGYLEELQEALGRLEK